MIRIVETVFYLHNTLFHYTVFHLRYSMTKEEFRIISCEIIENLTINYLWRLTTEIDKGSTTKNKFNWILSQKWGRDLKWSIHSISFWLRNKGWYRLIDGKRKERSVRNVLNSEKIIIKRIERAKRNWIYRNPKWIRRQ